MNQTEIIVKTYALGFSVIQKSDYHLAPTYFYAHEAVNLNWITTIYPKPDGSFETYKQELINYLQFYKGQPTVIIGSDIATLAAIPNDLYAHQYILTSEKPTLLAHQTALSEVSPSIIPANSLCFIDARMLASIDIKNLCSMLTQNTVNALVFGYYSHQQDKDQTIQNKMIKLIQSLAAN